LRRVTDNSRCPLQRVTDKSRAGPGYSAGRTEKHHDSERLDGVGGVVGFETLEAHFRMIVMGVFGRALAECAETNGYPEKPPRQ
jgi:hypothetical protein